MVLTTPFTRGPPVPKFEIPAMLVGGKEKKEKPTSEAYTPYIKARVGRSEFDRETRFFQKFKWVHSARVTK